MSVFYFVIICVSGCNFYFNQTNEYFNSPTYEGCIVQARELISIRGLSGDMSIKCTESKITIKEIK